ncbi:8-oxo-dGTP diphosphatase [Clostridiales bacterium BX7]|uniref:8-oxo-dGTP diphosphatase n=2 Tax=Feifania hominis TaxID=2763660 RepID=A0A926HTJ4_9FIRM|nr:8-oxo-dGTP diphosphatase [Feifania hominis]MBC8535368.1 8-oxo-dGTP diphosphatase [Feifania hominis]
MVCDREGRVLMQRRTGTNWAGVAFPGGHVEPGESFVESVIREVREETGYTIHAPTLCGVKQFPTDDGARYVIFLYRADRFSGSLCSSAEGEVFWVKRDEMGRYPLAADMLEILPVFDDCSKSEFYYYQDRGQWKYKVL